MVLHQRQRRLAGADNQQQKFLDKRTLTGSAVQTLADCRCAILAPFAEDSWSILGPVEPEFVACATPVNESD